VAAPVIVLARHGESEYSARGRLNGDVTVPVRLTERGREEARRLGAQLQGEPFELCVVSEFQRVRETADVALAGRDVPRLVVPELNDPRYGPYEGAEIEEYRAWASTQPSSVVPEGGESRLQLVERYVRGFRLVLARPEESILVVGHSLPISYALGAREGTPPGARVPLAEHATPYPFTREELAAAVDLLDAWAASPTW
jgi:broad specificity phosphatase PhoE